jgi:hypothetical protein
VKSDATTPADRIANLPHDRQVVMKKLRQVIRKHLPKGFRETIGYRMLAYVVPHRLYPAG